MRGIRIENLSKSREEGLIIDNLSLEIPHGQFFALLGPSGCGKTTLLRLLAGLDHATSGKIFLDDEDITDVPIHKRHIKTVFQNYALFSHFNVFENVAYSLRLMGVEEKELKARVMHALRTVRLAGHEGKSTQNLSGGQQQRVALARAIVSRPDVLLLDEPLAALDLKLKEQMLVELIDLQAKLGTTFVYVTHDQAEALTVADTMAIMNTSGKIEQLDSPKKIYEYPATCFVANFVGSTNFIRGTLRRQNDILEVESEGIPPIKIYVSSEKNWMIPGRRLHLSIRPEKIKISKSFIEGFANVLEGKVMSIIYYGRSTGYRVKLRSGRILHVFAQNEEHFPQETIDYDDHVYLFFQKENIIVLEH
ncbi:ABC transporter ATP-binding protein [Candidatus Babeliales bacterium]|nr:ABC transporter ATP-binding protein [Candidatus Babeliales bacterium]